MREIDQVREYWDRQPCNVRHSDKPIGSLEWSRELLERKYCSEWHIINFAQHAKWRGKNVLEVGCGLGTDAIRFAHFGANVVATDFSEISLKLARKRFDVMGHDIETVHADAEHLSDYIPEEPYDLIYSFGVLHHTPNPERALSEMRKFAMPGTVLKVMVYHRYSWKALRIWLGLDQPEAQAGCPIARTYSRAQARKLIEDAGFEIIEMRVDHIFPYSIPEYIRHEYKKVWYFRWMPRPLFRLLERTIGWHLLITAKVEEP